MMLKSFSDYKLEASNWITLAGGEYYPDILKDACALYKPVLVLFGQLVKSSESSSRLFLTLSEVPETWMRVQLLRVFKRYVCPVFPVEMTKRKAKAVELEKEFNHRFRPIQQRLAKGIYAFRSGFLGGVCIPSQKVSPKPQPSGWGLASLPP